MANRITPFYSQDYPRWDWGVDFDGDEMNIFHPQISDLSDDDTDDMPDLEMADLNDDDMPDLEMVDSNDNKLNGITIIGVNEKRPLYGNIMDTNIKMEYKLFIACNYLPTSSYKIEPDNKKIMCMKDITQLSIPRLIHINFDMECIHDETGDGFELLFHIDIILDNSNKANDRIEYITI